jgi:hypothetical protein
MKKNTDTKVASMKLNKTLHLKQFSILVILLLTGFNGIAQFGLKYISGAATNGIEHATVINKNRILLNFYDRIIELDSNLVVKKSITGAGLGSFTPKYGFQRTRDGVIFVIGTIGSGTTYFYKFDNALTTCLWTKAYTGIGETQNAYDKNCFISDSTTSSFIIVTGTSGNSSAAITKLDSAGNFIYSRKIQCNPYSGAFVDKARKLNSLYLLHNRFLIDDPYVLKTDLMGNVTKGFSIKVGDSLNIPVRISATDDNHLLIYGETYSKFNITKKHFILKCDTLGNTVWCKTFFVNSGGTLGLHGAEELNNNYVYSGGYNPGTGPSVGALFCFDSNGNYLLNKTYRSIASGGSNDGTYGLSKINGKLIGFGGGGGNVGPTLFYTDPSLNFSSCLNGTLAVTVNPSTPTLATISSSSCVTFTLSNLGGSPGPVPISNTPASVLNPCGLSTSIEENNNSSIISIYPNPNQGKVHIELAEDTDIQLINTIGQIVYKGSLKSGHNTLNLSSLSEGIYYLNLKNEGIIRVHKIIKKD